MSVLRIESLLCVTISLLFTEPFSRNISVEQSLELSLSLGCAAIFVHLFEGNGWRKYVGLKY